ncbi:hypothetical protein KDA11_04295 [Candidatus Saccharibacteria bacterium]|nr:hypothetical protein [Candidatus Saccharibacteria bacterium]
MTILLIIFFVTVVIFMVTGISGAPWVPARAFDIDKILDDTKLHKYDVFYELGCGDGRLVKAAAMRGAIAIGYELNPFLWLISWLRCRGVSGATIRFGNFWNINLGKADVVMAFLVPRTMPRLDKKASKELKSGARLVSYVFPILGRQSLASSGSWFIYKYPKSS